jgi:hypothetical protein
MATLASHANTQKHVIGSNGCVALDCACACCQSKALRQYKVVFEENENVSVCYFHEVEVVTCIGFNLGRAVRNRENEQLRKIFYIYVIDFPNPGLVCRACLREAFPEVSQSWVSGFGNSVVPPCLQQYSMCILADINTSLIPLNVSAPLPLVSKRSDSDTALCLNPVSLLYYSCSTHFKKSSQFTVDVFWFG